MSAEVRRDDVALVLDDVVRAARGCPLFLFLDPCGIGLPYRRLVSVLNGPRAAARWPPTEFLLNFSLEAVRRIAGRLSSPHGAGREATLARLDEACGGSWWRAHLAEGVDEDSVSTLVGDLRHRLERETGMSVVVVPVRRAPDHVPLYHLIFGTRSNVGLWAFGDSVARATETWWDGLEEVERGDGAGQQSLFTATSTYRPSMASAEERALPKIVQNLRALMRSRDTFRLVDHVTEVFGDEYGQVRERVARRAVKALHEAGLTRSEGTGGKTRDLFVVRSGPVA